MKTTENISLAGYAFTVESDAYAELERYLTEIQRCFEGNDSADERVADIERRIGDPNELAGNDTQSSSEQTGAGAEVDGTQTTRKGWRSKRLYRNIEERVLGGVCSGLGCYFRIDKVLFRLLFIIVFILGCLEADNGLFLLSLLLLYICLWIAMPAARTVEQKCELKGKPMHLNSYRSKDFDLKKEAKDAAASPAVRTVKRAGGAFLGILLLIAGLAGLLSCIFIPTAPELLRNSMADYWSQMDAEELLFAKIIIDRVFWWITLGVCGLISIWSVYNGVILTFGLKTPSWKPGLILFALWIISILALAAWPLREVSLSLHRCDYTHFLDMRSVGVTICDSESALVRGLDLAESALRVLGELFSRFPGIFCSLFYHLRLDVIESLELEFYRIFPTVGDCDHTFLKKF